MEGKCPGCSQTSDQRQLDGIIAIDELKDTGHPGMQKDHEFSFRWLCLSKVS